MRDLREHAETTTTEEALTGPGGTLHIATWAHTASASHSGFPWHEHIGGLTLPSAVEPVGGPTP